MNSEDSQTESKKKSRHFFLVLVTTVLFLAIISGVVFLTYLGRTNYGPGPVDIEVTTDKPFYLQGETVFFVIYVNNPQDWPVAHPDYAEYEIEKDGEPITYTNSVDICFGADMIPTFPAHARTSYSPPLLWNQKTRVNETYVQVHPGNYTLIMTVKSFGYEASGNYTFEIR